MTGRPAEHDRRFMGGALWKHRETGLELTVLRRIGEHHLLVFLDDIAIDLGLAPAAVITCAQLDGEYEFQGRMVEL